MADQQPIRPRADAQDLTGKRFGRWTVLGLPTRRRYPSGQTVLFWRCRCDCGVEKDISGKTLYRGHLPSRSCGCLRREVRASQKTHGLSHTRAYQSWINMFQRCYDRKCPAYRYYGALGVTVCERWHSVEDFYTDMGERPEGMTLDRIDPFGNYEPGNCRWADVSTQAKNTRCQRRIVHNGLDLHVEEWEKRTGINHEVIWLRIHKHGWDVERALTEPVGPPFGISR